MDSLWDELSRQNNQVYIEYMEIVALKYGE